MRTERSGLEILVYLPYAFIFQKKVELLRIKEETRGFRGQTVKVNTLLSFFVRNSEKYNWSYGPCLEKECNP